jgi:hypothetical protein
VIYALVALVIVQALLTVVMTTLLVELLHEYRWVKAVLVPWINALNTKLGLPK